MGLSRDLADSAPVINTLDGVTSNVQTQLVGKQAFSLNLTDFVDGFVLPTTDGTSGQVLSTNGTGTLSFVDGSDPNALTSSDIGSSVQGYDLNLTDFLTEFTLPITDGTSGQVLSTNGIGTLSFVDGSDPNALTSSDIGVTVQPYNASTLTSSDINVTVQPYNVNTLTSSDIGVTVQPYVTGILTQSDIGSSVQDYDLNLTDFLTEFTLPITDGTSGQVLQTNGLGTLSFVDVAGGSAYGDTDVGTYLSANGYDTSTNIIASITDSAPATLDTLNELAAALGDDPNFATTVSNSLGLKANTADLAAVATSGSYTDLTGTPTLATVATSGSYTDLTGTPTLAAVATSGSYTDLTGTPTLAAVATSGSYTDLTGTPTIPTSLTDLGITDGTSGQVLTTNGLGSFTFTNTASGDPTLGTLTKEFTQNEEATIALSSPVLVPVVSVTKAVGVASVLTDTSFDVNSTTKNYTREDFAPATTLDWVGNWNDSYYIAHLNTSAEEQSNRDIAFNSDGTKMFTIGNQTNAVLEYNLITGFDLSTASYSQSFSPSDTSPEGLAFNSDGTKMFLLLAANDFIYEYDLTTGFDISTASASYSQYFHLATQDFVPRGIRFNTDGTKLIMLGANNGKLFEYDLTTGFDLSTISYSGISVAVTGNTGLFCNNTGTRLYVVGQGIHEYTMSTPFDISTLTFVQTLYSIQSGGSYTTQYGAAFSADDRKLFIIDNYGGMLFEYVTRGALQLGTGPFSVTDVGKTIEANSGSFVLTSTEGTFEEIDAPTSYNQVASGNWSMHSIRYNTTDQDLELSGYNIGYDVPNLTFTQDFSVASQEVVPNDVTFNTDGTKMFVVGPVSDKVHEYALTTGFDLSTASFAQSYSVAAYATSPYCLKFNLDGTKMFVMDIAVDRIRVFTLTTGFDISTASYTTTSGDLGINGSVSFMGMTFSPDGMKVYLVNTVNDAIYEYWLPEPFDVTTSMVGHRAILNISYYGVNPVGIAFNPSDGTQMFVIQSSSRNVDMYKLRQPFSVSQIAAYPISTSIYSVGASVESAPRGIAFSADGTKMFTTGNTNDKVYEWSVGSFSAPTGYSAAFTTVPTNTENWGDLNSMTADEAAADGNIYYAVSRDNNTTWAIIDNTNGVRNIVRNNSGTWQYNSSGTYASETWNNANVSNNTELGALVQSMTIAENKMDKAQLDAVTDSNHFSLTSTIDLAIMFSMTAGSGTPPSSNGVTINYDNAVVNRGAILGTDYEFEAPTQDSVKIKALAAGSYKIRVV